MLPAEPAPTAVLLVIAAILMGISVIFSRASGRLGVPVTLLFLLIGMLAGEEGLGRIAFADYAFTFRIGTIALVLILFDGGLNTPVESLKLGVAPAGVLATAGVAATAGLTALGAHWLGLAWNEAVLLGAVVSSTDAAAVFAVLRGSGLRLQRRVGVTLELESGVNDPMAVILTIEATRAIVEQRPLGWTMAVDVLVQLVVGGVAGAAVGLAGRALLRRVQPAAAGLYPVLTLALAFAAFGIATLLDGSGFLSVYVAGVLLGNATVPYRSGLLRVHDAVAWLSQVSMFLLLGLLAYPSDLLRVGWVGLGVAALLAVVVRPLVVAVLLAPFRFRRREIAYAGLVGLRGAVPIILATYPVLAGVPGAGRVLNVVFFVVVVSSLVPGTLLRQLTRWLRLEHEEPPPPPAALEVYSTRMMHGDIVPYYIQEASAAAHCAISDLPFPPDTVVMLIVRGDELVAPRGGTVLTPGDHVYVLCRPEDRALVGLVLGRVEDE